MGYPYVRKNTLNNIMGLTKVFSRFAVLLDYKKYILALSRALEVNEYSKRYIHMKLFSSMYNRSPGYENLRR